MAATATRRLRLEKQEQYSNEDQWGPELNEGALDRADEALSTTAVTVNGSDYTLTSENFITDEARSFTIIVSGTGGAAVIAPAVDKPYIVINNCSSDITFKPSGGTGATVRAGTAVTYYTNAAGDTGYVIDLPLDKINTATADVPLGGYKLTGVGAATNTNDAATLANKIHEFTAPTAALAMNSQKITGVADPTNAQDAATKIYIDTLAASSDLGTVAAIAPDIQTLADIEDGTVAADAISIAASISDEIALVAAIDEDVVQLAGMFAGASATDPTTRLDGSALQAGDYYLNTSGKATVNVYDGANWIPIGSVTIASQAEAEAGTNNTNVMTPLRTDQYVDARLASQVQAEAGTDTEDLMTPIRTAQAIAAQTSGYAYQSSATASGDAAIEFSIDATKPKVVFELRNVKPSSDSGRLLLAPSIDGGSSFTPSITMALVSVESSAGTVDGGRREADSTQYLFDVAIGNAAGEHGISGTIEFSQQSGLNPSVVFRGKLTGTSGEIYVVHGAAEYDTTSTVTDLQFKFNAGNITSGTIDMYYMEQ